MHRFSIRCPSFQGSASLKEQQSRKTLVPKRSQGTRVSAVI